MTHTEREMIATVVPGGGAASFVTLVSRFGEYGVTRNDAALATMLYSVVGHLSFIAVAIPAFLFYAFLTAKARHLMHDLERAGVEIVNLIEDSREDRRILAFDQNAAPSNVIEATPALKAATGTKGRPTKS